MSELILPKYEYFNQSKLVLLYSLLDFELLRLRRSGEKDDSLLRTHLECDASRDEWSDLIMNIYASDLRESIIQPCLNVLGQYSRDAENLLVGTAMQASSVKNLHCTGLSQRGLGIYRITPEKHREIWDKYLIQFPDLASSVRGFASQKQFFNDPHGELISNLNYATVIAWMIYRAAGVELTKTTDVVKATDSSTAKKAADFAKEACKMTNINKPLDVNSLAQLWALHFDNGTGCARNAEDFIATYRNPALNLDCRKMVA